jgi:hypothetical protein
MFPLQRIYAELTHVATKVNPYIQIQYKTRFSDNRQATDILPWIRARLYKEPCREEPFLHKRIQKLSVQLWTTEAEEVADS